MGCLAQRGVIKGVALKRNWGGGRMAAVSARARQGVFHVRGRRLGSDLPMKEPLFGMR
ncbi:hypothetical protein [Sodalis ligni]|uniref:hypothetical protein n=1 Tax=Sodalis ligni TaxID=2697027 RepID=UPI0014052F40|nr:hypothetical protein [Sodalis ligni]